MAQWLPLLLTSLLLDPFIAPALSQTIVNGDFEEPAWAWVEGTGRDTVVYHRTGADGQNEIDRAYTFFWVSLPGGSTYLPGWTVAGSGVYHCVDNLPWWKYSSSGNHCIQLYRWYSLGDYRGGSISQTVSGLHPGTNYFLSLDLIQPSLGPESTVTVTIGAKSFKLLNSTYGRWQTHTIPFTAAASSALLSIATPERTVSNVYVDKVRLSTQANASVILQSKLLTGIRVEGRQGSTYRIEWAPSLDSIAWNLLTRIVVTNSPTWVHDESVSIESRRFYRAVEE